LPNVLENGSSSIREAAPPEEPKPELFLAVFERAGALSNRLFLLNPPRPIIHSLYFFNDPY